MAQDISINFNSNSKELEKSFSSISRSISVLQKEFEKTGQLLSKISEKNSLDDLAKSTNETQKSVSGLNKKFEELDSTNSSFIGTIAKVATGLGAITATASTLGGVASATNMLADAFTKVGSTVFKFDGGLFSAIKSTATLGALLVGLGQSINNSADTSVGKLTGTLVTLSGVILGGFAAGISVAITKVGEFAHVMGTQLVAANQKAVDSFAKVQKETVIFNRTIEAFTGAFGDSVGTLDRWTKTINGVSDATGFTRDSLQFAVTEIVAATSQMGLNEKQMRQLLDVVVDYGTITGDVRQSTIDFIGALNGQSQSVIKYGVKLTDAGIQQKLLKKGVDESFSSFTEHEKITTRFNVLLDQYSLIAGKAAATSQTLSGQNQILANNQFRLASAYGEGAAVIENVNVLNFALNQVLNNVSESVVKATGFFGALGARLLQVGGFILEYSFKVYAAIAAIKILNAVLSTDLTQTLFAKSIPLVGSSINNLVENILGAGAKVSSLKELLKVIGVGLANQARLIIAGLVGVQAASLTFATAVSGAFTVLATRIAGAMTIISGALATLLTNPVVLGIAAIVVSLYATYKALGVINERTGIFTRLLATLTEVLKSASPVLEFFANIFRTIGDAIATAADKLLGRFVYALTVAIKGILQLMQKTAPILEFFGVQMPTGIQESVDSLTKLQNELKTVGYETTKLPKNAERAVAGVNSAISHIDLEKLKRLEDELRDIGLTELDKLKREREERIKTLNETFPHELKLTTKYAALKLKIEQDYLDKRSGIEDKARKERDQKEQESIKRMKEISDSVSSASSAPFKRLFGGSQKIAGASSGEQSSADQQSLEAAALAAGAMAAEGVTAGKDGFSNLIGGAIEGVASMFGPIGEAIGAIIAPIIQMLGKSKEAVQQTVRDFVDGAVDFVNNLIMNIPVLIAEIARAGPRMLKRIIDSIPEVITAFAEGMIDAAIALSLEMPMVAFTFISSMIENVPRIVEAIFDAIKSAPKQAVKGVGGFFKGIGFAEGGQAFTKSVPGGYPSDSFPAQLTSGELVVDRSTAYKLKNFLDMKQSDGQSTSSAGGISSMDNRPIIISIDGREIVRAVRSQVRAGFVL